MTKRVITINPEAPIPVVANWDEIDYIQVEGSYLNRETMPPFLTEALHNNVGFKVADTELCKAIDRLSL